MRTVCLFCIVSLSLAAHFCTAQAIARVPALVNIDQEGASGSQSFGMSPKPNLFQRLGRYYEHDWNPKPEPVNASGASATPQKRGLPSPLESPPFPSADWSYGGSPDIGAPNPTGTPLMTALYGADRAAKARNQIYGWIEPGFNFSTSGHTNLPAGYDLYPNKIELHQAVIYVERIPDTVQTKRFDWGYHLTAWYGVDYRYTTQKGILSDQLLKYNRQYGFDVPFEYIDLYFPRVAQGMNIRVGRFASMPGIEVEAAPSNYTFTHSLLSIYSPFTVSGIIATFKLSDRWLIQAGITAGNDVAPWAAGAKPSTVACADYTTRSVNDNVYLCANGINSGEYAYDNVQQYDVTWYHRWSKTLHTASEGWYMYQLDVPAVDGVGGSPPILPLAGTSGAVCPPGERRCTAPAWAIQNYINREFSSKLYLSFRNEFLDDQKGQRTGYQTRYSEHTLALGKWIGTTVLIRPELRYGHSYDLAAYNGGRNHGQLTFDTDLTFHF
ncbi:MAG: outer membrane beta-barrel protein [Acidobacteriaceae bacterium]